MTARLRFFWILLACSTLAALLASAADGPPPLTGVYRVLGTNADGSRYAGMAAVTETGGKFTFRRWVGSQALTGTGSFDDGKLAVKWSDETSVVYMPGIAGNLRGKWADGKASENLKLLAYAAGPAVSIKEGTYSVSGRSVKGEHYKGMVTIARKGAGYTLSWRVGNEAYSGEGTMESNVLTVNWGDATPVVYALTGEGYLRGLRAAGAVEETLAPE